MPSEPTIVILCELGDLDGLTHQEAAVFEDALRAAAAHAFPGRRVRGLWVHKSNRGDPASVPVSKLRALAATSGDRYARHWSDALCALCDEAEETPHDG